MKTATLVIGLLLSIGSIFAQMPKLYIHIVSHNEPTDTLQNSLKYTKAKDNALQFANIVNSENVKWNLQTSDGFVLGALNDESATTTNIFETLASPPYNDNIEIDPRSKNMNGRNVADQWYLLDSLGGNPTTTLGGFIWAVCPPASTSSIDWLQYRDTITGNIYGNKWKCSLLSGAGSLFPHCNDLNDFGVFKPNTTTDFYTHNPSESLWCLGTGCAPKLDSLDDEQAIIDLIQAQVDSIQNGLWPSNKFYLTRIMTNQREYGPLFFQKISKVIDSLNSIPSAELEWATISETFTAFHAWQTTSGLDYSQWQCGQTTTGIVENERNDNYKIYPNPFTNILTMEFADNQKHQIEIVDFLGRIIYNDKIQSQFSIDLSKFSKGIYLIKVEGKSQKIIKN
jgi:hypothetical protein